MSRRVYVWKVEVCYSGLYGFECVCCEDTFREALDRKREYRENEPGYPVRIRRGWIVV